MVYTRKQIIDEGIEGPFLNISEIRISPGPLLYHLPYIYQDLDKMSPNMKAKMNNAITLAWWLCNPKLKRDPHDILQDMDEEERKEYLLTQIEPEIKIPPLLKKVRKVMSYARKKKQISLAYLEREFNEL